MTRHLAPALAAIALLLLVGYFSAYYALVTPLHVWAGSLYRMTVQPSSVVAVYGTSDVRLTQLFAPAHWLDRKLRPWYWEPMIFPEKPREP